MSLLSVEQAQQRLLSDVQPLGEEQILLGHAHRRVLADQLTAPMNQPPFSASAMDGYAVCSSDISNQAEPKVKLSIIGASSAGHPFAGQVGKGQVVRIFTGAQVPEGADAVVAQEDCERLNDTEVLVKHAPSVGEFIRPIGYDFHQGDLLLDTGTQLNYRHLALIASMNLPQISVCQNPRVAILATGDELIPPGNPLGPGQIVSSVPFGMKALIEGAGGKAQMLGIAQDNLDSLTQMIEEAHDFDVLVTIGGASVGEHDLVQQALKDQGMQLDFWKIAMRPGKPLMVGTLGQQKVIGVPGNPVSALICCYIFVLPLIRALQGAQNHHPVIHKLPLLTSVPENKARQHYMRAIIETDTDNRPLVACIEDQDSSLQANFAKANALILRMPHAPSANPGDLVDVLTLDEF